MTSLLAKDASKVDNELNALFARTKSIEVPAKPAIQTEPNHQVKSTKKRKRIQVENVEKDLDEVSIAQQAAKRLKAAEIPGAANPSAKGSSKSGETSQIQDDAVSLISEDDAEEKPTRTKPDKLTAEERVERDTRTIFIGNVPIGAVTNRKLKKAFNALLQEHVGDATVESVRFRSLPLTSAVSAKSPTKQPETSSADQLNHAQKRSKTWSKRHANEDNDEAELAQPEQKFLTTAQKRKVAFITGDLQPNDKAKNGCNAYVVLSTAAAVQPMVKSINGAIFEEHTLRADAVVKSPVRNRDEARRTVFVGGVDFEESEDGLRKWIDGLIKGERGNPDDAASWVESVRIIKDAATGLGKGFALALLHDRECVDELLAMDDSKLKLSKRKIRFQKYKLSVKPATDAKDKSKRSSDKGAASKRPSIVKKPRKMDKAAAEKVGQELSGLSKDERRRVKSEDADRVARRMAKKAAKSAQLKRDSRMEQLKKKKGDSVLKKLGRKLGKSAKASTSKSSTTASKKS